MKTLALIFIVLSPYFIFSQFRYKIFSNPDSAHVKLNNKTVAQTPCYVDFYWRDAVDDKIIISVEKEGYEDWADTIFQKPKQFNFTKDIQLERKDTLSPIYDSTHVVGFDKLVVNFKEGKKVGVFTNYREGTEDFLWKGSVKIGDKYFEERVYDFFANSGFNTPTKEGAKLFNQKKQLSSPRYILGVELDNYFFNIKEIRNKKIDRNKIYSIYVKMNLSWYVFDQKSEEVIYNYKNEGVGNVALHEKMSDERNNLAFENALIDFINNSDIKEILKVKDEPETNQSTSDFSDTIHISRNETEHFEGSENMLNYASNSCVTIITENGHGSGVVIDESGLILTANHVVEHAHKVKVKLKSGTSFDGKVVFSNSKKDIALVLIPGEGYNSLNFSNVKEEFGEEVYSIGTPASEEFNQSLSKGIVSGSREIDGEQFIQINMALSPGNSGGPLLNKNGEILGVVLNKIVGVGIEGINFAIPANEIIKAANIVVQ